MPASERAAPTERACNIECGAEECVVADGMPPGRTAGCHAGAEHGAWPLYAEAVALVGAYALPERPRCCPSVHADSDTECPALSIPHSEAAPGHFVLAVHVHIQDRICSSLHERQTAILC